VTADPEKEQQRLAHLYASMTPEELEKLADDAASLTDVAREALKTEIARKGLAITVNEATRARPETGAGLILAPPQSTQRGRGG